MRTWAALILGVALLGGCGDDTTTTAADGAEPIDAELFTIHPVLREASPPCDAFTVEAGEVVVAEPSDDAAVACLVLGPAAVDTTDIADAAILATASADRFAVAIDLDAEGTGALNALAQEYVGERLAMLMHGRLVSAPVIEQPEFTGGVAAVDLTRDEAVELVTAVGGDPTVPPPDPDAASSERARAVCDAFLPQAVVGASPGIAVVETAGSITASLGDAAIEPWRSLPADHFVAGCSYLLPPVGMPSTTICPNGDAVSLELPQQYFVDEEGRSTEAPIADGLVAPSCP